MFAIALRGCGPTYSIASSRKTFILFHRMVVQAVRRDLRERMRKGPVTLEHDELERIIAMLEILSERCGAAYQIVGMLASEVGLFHDPSVVKALDVLTRPLIEGDILPFHPEPVSEPRDRPLAKSRRASKKKSPSWASPAAAG